ncbi:hypothetical protein AVEN_191130-1 [Araneus ventricosus]|uniref:Uncharacterized protein n=1 Tax=Araneus ventricosus TaxID=182803 RepID=A0A4Y2AY42_ARAVE|nr:hypothetical protein AVEN_191130-1 [Araneus ventricosus]
MSLFSYSGQFNSLSARRLYALQTCLQLIQVFVRRGRCITRSSKGMPQRNLGVRSESFCAEVHPVTDFPCSVLGPFQALQAWNSLHHFSMSRREVGPNKIALGFYARSS